MTAVPIDTTIYDVTPNRGFLAVVMLIVMAVVSGYYYSEYQCYDLINHQWLNESQLTHFQFVSLSCLPTGLAYVFRDFVQLYLGRAIAIYTIIIAAMVILIVGVLTADEINTEVLNMSLISAIVFLSVEGINQVGYEFTSRRNVEFSNRIVIACCISGFADAIIWKFYLNIINIPSIILSGLLMAVPAIAFSIILKIYKKRVT